jgi:DNA repair photolyase
METRQSAELLGACGRGATSNPGNRFEQLDYEPDLGALENESPRPVRTRYFRDASRTVIAYNNSPDVGFDAGLNPSRGCEHGCAYCYARPTHEFLGFSAGIDFESMIMVKENAADLLREELSSRKWKPQVLAMSGVTDCYQPIERRLGITRRCLEVLAEFRNPVSIITKNHLVTRDIDLLGRLVEHHAAVVNISITTLDPHLARSLEPRASVPSRRLSAVQELAKSGIPVNVMMAPIIPGLTDHEIPRLLDAAARAGASSATYTIVRLPLAVAPIFSEWLDRHRPMEKQKVLERLKAMRRGKLNDPRFGERMRGDGAFADQIRQMFRISCRRYGLEREVSPLSTAAFRVPGSQLDLF